MADILNMQFVVVIGPISWWYNRVQDLLFSRRNIGIICLSSISLVILLHGVVYFDAGFILNKCLWWFHLFIYLGI